MKTSTTITVMTDQQVVVGEAAEGEPSMLWESPKLNPKTARSGMLRDAVGAVGESGPETPSRLLTAMRKISPKPRVTMAR